MAFVVVAVALLGLPVDRHELTQAQAALTEHSPHMEKSTHTEIDEPWWHTVNEEGYLSPKTKAVKTKTVRKKDWWFDQDDIRCHDCDWYTDGTSCGKNSRCFWDYGKASKGGQKCFHKCSFEVNYPEHRACYLANHTPGGSSPIHEFSLNEEDCNGAVNNVRGCMWVPGEGRRTVEVPPLDCGAGTACHAKRHIFVEGNGYCINSCAAHHTYWDCLSAETRGNCMWTGTTCELGCHKYDDTECRGSKYDEHFGVEEIPGSEQCFWKIEPSPTASPGQFSFENPKSKNAQRLEQLGIISEVSVAEWHPDDGYKGTYVTIPKVPAHADGTRTVDDVQVVKEPESGWPDVPAKYTIIEVEKGRDLLAYKQHIDPDFDLSNKILAWDGELHGKVVVEGQGGKRCFQTCSARPDKKTCDPLSNRDYCEWDDCKRECKDSTKAILPDFDRKAHEQLKSTCYDRGYDQTWYWNYSCTGQYSPCYLTAPAVRELPKCRVDCLALNKLGLDPAYAAAEPTFPGPGFMKGFEPEPIDGSWTSAAEGDDDDDFDQFEREAKKERARRTSLLDDLFAREWEQQQAQQHQAQHEPQHKPSQQLRASASSAAAHANARRGSQQRKSSGGTAAAAPPAARAATTALVATYRGENYRFTGPVDILDIPLAGEQPYARERFSADSAVAAAMRAKDVSYAALLQAALSGDTLSILCNMVGLRRFHIFGMVCTAWHDAIKAKMREWGVLTYVRSMGKGFGKLPGYFDMPTWLCMVPDGAWGSNVCVVDACNYRLQILSPDGTLLRTVGRPGARFGQLSSPSSVAHDPKRGGLPVVFSSSNVGPEDRRILSFDLDSWALLQSTPEGTGATQLDAPEGMAIASDTLYVVDTANHRIVAFSASTLEKVGQYPPLEWHAAGHGKRWDQLNSPHGIAAFEGELFVSDTHNDRIQVFTEALEWIGQIGQKGKGAGQFTYPKGVTVASSGSAPPLLYVCEQTRIQALSLLGEPRIIIAVPGALNLCGICTDGARVYCTDMDAHRVHVLRLTHSERWREKRREAIEEAKARRELRGGGSEGRNESDEQRKRAQERSEKERRRDRAVGAMLGGSSAHQMLGLPSSASEPELRQGIRLAMRLLHPDLAMNMTLKGTREYERIVAAFKKANNLKDIRIEAWFSGEEMK